MNTAPSFRRDSHGIGTVLADDCRLTDRSGRKKPSAAENRADSQLRLPLESKMAESAMGDVLW
jgi:diaminohydroxyphosphoribosylaminopyrimidine deaminase/5-amino-6-(5-phosphoribosylamino)uracil reductase